jgi:hypothetical protein
MHLGTEWTQDVHAEDPNELVPQILDHCTPTDRPSRSLQEAIAQVLHGHHAALW